MRSLILYETSHCHLCELAQAVLIPFVERSLCSVELLDVADDDHLLALYGTRIPVLLDVASQAILCWPFSTQEVTEWLYDVSIPESVKPL